MVKHSIYVMYLWCIILYGDVSICDVFYICVMYSLEMCTMCDSCVFSAVVLPDPLVDRMSEILVCECVFVNDVRCVMYVV